MNADYFNRLSDSVVAELRQDALLVQRDTLLAQFSQLAG